MNINLGLTSNQVTELRTVCVFVKHEHVRECFSDRQTTKEAEIALDLLAGALAKIDDQTLPKGVVRPYVVERPNHKINVLRSFCQRVRAAALFECNGDSNSRDSIYSVMVVANAISLELAGRVSA